MIRTDSRSLFLPKAFVTPSADEIALTTVAKAQLIVAAKLNQRKDNFNNTVRTLHYFARDRSSNLGDEGYFSSLLFA